MELSMKEVVMKTLRWTTPLVALALVAAPLGAQQMGAMHGAGHQGMAGQGTLPTCSMMGGPGMMMGAQGAMGGYQGTMGSGGMAGHQGMMAGGTRGMNPAAMGTGALFGGADLALTPDQQTKLDDLVATARQEHLSHMQAAMSVQSGAAEALAGSKPDMDAYEQMMKQAATQMVEAQMTFAKAAVEARALLTPEQLAKLPEGGQLVNTMMCGMMGHGSWMEGQPGGGVREQHPG